MTVPFFVHFFLLYVEVGNFSVYGYRVFLSGNEVLVYPDVRLLPALALVVDGLPLIALNPGIPHKTPNLYHDRSFLCSIKPSHQATIY